MYVLSVVGYVPVLVCCGVMLWGMFRYCYVVLNFLQNFNENLKQ